MRDFVEYVIKGLIDGPEDLDVAEVRSNGAVTYELRMRPEDVGKVIGRSGSTIQAVRQLLQVGAAKQGLRCSLEIVEDDRQPHASHEDVADEDASGEETTADEETKTDVVDADA